MLKEATPGYRQSVTEERQERLIMVWAVWMVFREATPGYRQSVTEERQERLIMVWAVWMCTK